ncbi:PIN domain-containing protein [Pseudomonas capsici]|uniref:PIN domain-containing protein n=1 Tax=Pseudomonas capsici TaxID=2810614 RepID=UPI0021F1ACC6|nr:PIN domain-containing protein [Pseudomonas capsici]MCV4285121.1 PIN domain-containing protein [Pseudomonas capsici]
MKLGNFAVLLPVYQIESSVTYHTERKPTVFERMVLRLCDPVAHFPDRQNLSLLSVFRDQLGAGDVRELLEGCVSELVALGALPGFSGRDSLVVPLAEFELTSEGVQFLRDDRLPVRSRTVKILHRYDPISDEIKPVNNDGARLSPGNLNRICAAEPVLRPQNPLAQVERAIAQEAYGWKNPATVIDRIVPVVNSTGWVQRKLEVSCSEDAVLSARAPQDSALQQWSEQAQPELAWDVLLADTLTSESTAFLPVIDSAVLRDARAARPIAVADAEPLNVRLSILAHDVPAFEAGTPAIVLSPEVSEPTLVFDSNSELSALHVPVPNGVISGFRKLSLAHDRAAIVHAEVAGKFRLYWAGQPRVCAMAVTLKDQAAAALWEKLRQDLEGACEHAEDPRIALLPVAWLDVSAIGEILWAWLASRTTLSLEDLFAVAEEARQAVALWRPDRKDWTPVWEVALAKAVDGSLTRSTNKLALDKTIALLNQMKEMLPQDKAEPRQIALLRHAAPVRLIEELKQLRTALPSAARVPEELLAAELRQAWLGQTLAREELKLYGPHVLQHPLQNIEKAVQAIYRDIGEQALKATENRQIDARNLTPRALDAVHAWRETAEDFGTLNAPSSQWDSLNEAVERWNLLAQEKLAPVEAGRRIVVLDTSALMEHAELLLQLRPGDVPVVPRRVLSELDGLKTSEDQSRSAKARRAIRQLEGVSSRIRHEAEYTDLLPAEWDAKEPDHAILSTALFFRLNAVLIVSNDNNLRNKARSLGLTAEDARVYAPARGPSGGAASNSSKKRNEGKINRT